jgi:hypothetical protein
VTQNPFGLHVHKDSIDIAVADAGGDSEVRRVGCIGGNFRQEARARRDSH